MRYPVAEFGHSDPLTGLPGVQGSHQHVEAHQRIVSRLVTWAAAVLGCFKGPQILAWNLGFGHTAVAGNSPLPSQPQAIAVGDVSF